MYFSPLGFVCGILGDVPGNTLRIEVSSLGRHQ